MGHKDKIRCIIPSDVAVCSIGVDVYLAYHHQYNDTVKTAVNLFIGIGSLDVIDLVFVTPIIVFVTTVMVF